MMRKIEAAARFTTIILIAIFTLCAILLAAEINWILGIVVMFVILPISFATMRFME